MTSIKTELTPQYKVTDLSSKDITKGGKRQSQALFFYGLGSNGIGIQNKVAELSLGQEIPSLIESCGEGVGGGLMGMGFEMFTTPFEGRALEA